MMTAVSALASLPSLLIAVEPGTIISLVVYALLAVAIGGVVIALITDDRDPSTVLAWLFVIMLLPVLGVIIYFLIGRNFRRDNPARVRVRHEMAELVEESLAPVLEANKAFTDAAIADLAGTPGGRIETAGQRESRFVPVPADTVEVYVAGAQKFPALLADLARAGRYIHLMYLIWEQDELTAKVTDVLLDRLAAGVEIHIIYDWLSASRTRRMNSSAWPRRRHRRPVLQAISEMNYRNHMKIAIIDGEVVYTGGMNMGQEYIDGGRRFAGGVTRTCA